MELLIRVVDKIGSDIYHDVKLTKRGHVIVVKPDGHDWTPTELTNPAWRIVRVTGISVAEAGALLAEEPGLETNRMLQRRAFKLNLDNPDLPNGVKNFIANDARPNPIGSVTLAQLRAIRTRLQSRQDPDPLP